jgi:hypothetical protein
MLTETQLVRPQTLQEGNHYLLVQPSPVEGAPASQAVLFVGYCPCPALVLVETETGEKMRCEREKLFLSGGNKK